MVVHHLSFSYEKSWQNSVYGYCGALIHVQRMCAHTHTETIYSLGVIQGLAWSPEIELLGLEQEREC